MKYLYITALSAAGDDYLITSADLYFYTKCMSLPVITVEDFTDWLDTHDCEIYSFYVFTENNTKLVELYLNPTKIDDILSDISDYLEYEIVEAVYQDLDVKIMVKRCNYV